MGKKKKVLLTSEEYDALKEKAGKADEHFERLLRLQADFDNFKKRLEKEKIDFIKFANEDIIIEILKILDDFERAFSSLPPKMEKLSWLDGVRLIERKLWAVLQAQGVSPIKALGEPFDPQFHEAVRQDKGKEGIVIEEVQKGYMLEDRVIRPTMVVVGNGEED